MPTILEKLTAQADEITEEVHSRLDQIGQIRLQIDILEAKKSGIVLAINALEQDEQTTLPLPAAEPRRPRISIRGFCLKYLAENDPADAARLGALLDRTPDEIARSLTPLVGKDLALTSDGFYCLRYEKPIDNVEQQAAQ